MNNLKNISESVLYDDSTGEVRYYFDGKEHPFVQLNASGAGNAPDTEIVLKGNADRPVRELVGLFDASNGGASWLANDNFPNLKPFYALDVSPLWNGAKELAKETVVSTGGYVAKPFKSPKIKEQTSKVFLPSMGEYEANPVVASKVFNAVYNDRGDEVWSRSVHGNGGAWLVGTPAGDVCGSISLYGLFSCAPAFNLDLEKILMVRSASSGKEPVPFMEVSNYHADSKDSNFKFVVEKPLTENVKIIINEQTSDFFSFSVSIQGKWNVSWISAVICDAEGKILFYCVIGSILDSEFKVDISSLPSGYYKINLYVEQRNDPYYTDYLEKIYSYFVIKQ